MKELSERERKRGERCSDLCRGDVVVTVSESLTWVFVSCRFSCESG